MHRPPKTLLPATALVVLAAAFALVTHGCGRTPEPAPAEVTPPSSGGDGAATAVDPAPDDPAVERARALAAEFTRRLQGELRDALAAGGPAHAIGVCAERAPALAADLSGNGVEIGRASHRTRNPANAPRDWLVPVVDAYVGADGAGGPTRVDLPDGRLGWVEPLRVGPPCLTCHGPDVDPGLLETIRDRYPQDTAIGFEPGAFRGVLWVAVPRGDEATGG